MHIRGGDHADNPAVIQNHRDNLAAQRAACGHAARRVARRNQVLVGHRQGRLPLLSVAGCAATSDVGRTSHVVMF
jgi:hypothetical protein